MRSSEISRREFLRKSAVLTGAALLPSFPLPGAESGGKRTAVDQVTLGKTGLKLSRLGVGTGSIGGRIQRDLGQEGFTRLLRHAFDRGITYIDTAQNYRTHEMIREAVKGLPREKLFILTKMPGVPEQPMEVLDRYRQELNTDYLDCVLSHCATKTDWDDERKRVLDALEEAKQKKILRAHGVSCHGLDGLTRATQVNWVEVHLVRVNPQGKHMDGPPGSQKEPSVPVEPVVKELKAMREKGRGIIGMKLIGNGDFTTPEDREKSIRFAMQCGLLDAVTIGFKSPAEIDEAIERINRALA